MIGFFLYLIVTFILVLISLPAILCFLLKRLLNLDILQIKMHKFTHYKSLLLKLPIDNNIWSVKEFILSIPDIQFNLNMKTFRLIILVRNVQAFFVHNNSILHQVRIIDGLMDPNIMANLLHFVIGGHWGSSGNTYFNKASSTCYNEFIKSLTKKIQKQLNNNNDKQKQQLNEKKSSTKTNQFQGQQQQQKGRLATLIQGGLHFLVMMVVQFLQLQLQQTTVSFVSSIPSSSLVKNSNKNNDSNETKDQKQQHATESSFHLNNNQSQTQTQQPYSLNFTTPYTRKSSLLLLRHLSELTLKIPQLSTKIIIINHYQQQIQLTCPRFEIINWSHPSQVMVKGKGFFLGIKVPVTLDISQSLKSLKYGINVQSLQFNTIPSDYVIVMQIIKSFSFSLAKLQELFINNNNDNILNNRSSIVNTSSLSTNRDSLSSSLQQQQQPKKQTQINVDIQMVDIVIEQFYQMNVDQKQAQEYLENISEARFALRGIMFKQKQFKIEQSQVKINRFRSLARTGSIGLHSGKSRDLNKSQINTSPRSPLHQDKPMLSIPNLIFSFYQKQTRVTHNPTQLYCGRQELAMFGKIFRLLNDRMRFDQLDCQLYMGMFAKYVGYLKCRQIQMKNFIDLRGDKKGYQKGQQSMKRFENNNDNNNKYVELFSYMCHVKTPYQSSSSLSPSIISKPILTRQQQPNKVHTNKNTFTQPQSQSQQLLQISPNNQTNNFYFIYQPSSLTFRLLLGNLQHTLFLPNCSYKQLKKKQQFQHILSIPSLDLNYSQIKQFGIKQLKMIFRQIPTLNQFALFVQSIAMKQNQQTLVQYLSGWIMLKKLLQITSEQSNITEKNDDFSSLSSQKDKQTYQNNINVNKKLTKKTITIRKFDLDYQRQTISIKKIQLQKTTLPNGKNLKLYFSIDKFQFYTKLDKKVGFNLKKVPQKYHKSNINIMNNVNNKQKQKHTSRFNDKSTRTKSSKHIDPTTQKSTQVVHNLFSFESLTISIKLQNIVKNIRQIKSLTIQKQKSLIHLKNPQITFPHFDISQKIFTVFQSYVVLKPHISAYIKDRTEDQFIKIKRNIKDFIIQPDFLHLKVTNFTIILQEQPMNNHITNYHRFIRQFLSKCQYKNLNKLSEIELISFLKKNKRQNNLCKITIKQIQCQLQPLSSVASDYKQSVDDWIREFNHGLEFHKKIKTSHSLSENKQIRLRKVQAAQYRFAIKGLQLSVRDYPQSIVNFSQLSIKLTCLKTMNIFNLKNYFFKGNMKYGKMVINAGLNMLSGFLEIQRKIKSYIEVFNKFQKTTQFASNLKRLRMRNKHSLLLQQKKFQSSYQPWWYILLNSSQWKFTVLKQPTKINLYTGTIPYENQSFEIILGNIKCNSELNNTQLKVNDLNIKLLDQKILQLQNINTNFRIRPDQRRNFHIISQIHAQNAGKITLSQQTIHYISTLKQLRNDWLILFGFYTENIYDDDQMLHKKQRMNYLEIINFTANKMIEEDQRNVIFLTAIKQIAVKIQVQEFNLILTNYKQGINLGMQEFIFQHHVRATKKIKNQWQTLMSNLQILRIWGSLLQNGQGSQQSIQRFTQHIKQNEQNMFLGARKLSLNFNKYKILRQQLSEKTKERTSSGVSLSNKPTQIVFIRKFMQLESIKLAMSLKIKKSIQKLIRSYSPQQLKKQFEQKTKKIFINQSYLPPIQRLKSAVWKVIRINKLKRRKIFGIKNFLFFAELGKVQFVLMSQKHSIVVDSRQNVRFDVSKIYKEDDKCFINPITKMFLRLRQVEIHLIEANQSNIVNLLTQSVNLSQAKEKKRLKLSYSESIQLLIHLQSQQSPINRRKGHSTGHLTLQNGSIQLTQKTKSILVEMIDFLVHLADDKEKKRMQFKKAHQKFNQLQNNGRQILKTKIQQNYQKIIEQKLQRLAFKWTFQVKNTVIQLIVPVEQKIKFELDSISLLTISKPFIKIDSQLIKCELNFYTNDKIQRTFQVNDLTIENLFQNQQNVFRKVVTMNHNDSLALYMTVESYDTLPLSQIVWEYFSSIKIHCNPIKFRVTQKLYQKFYEFMFPQEKYFQTKQQNSKQLIKKAQVPQNYQERFIPDFIRKLQIDDLKVQVWFETQSLIKRMQGISVKLNGYKTQKVFMTRKQLFDDWIKFVLKQMTGQLFNVLGQKLFGTAQNTQ